MDPLPSEIVEIAGFVGFSAMGRIKMHGIPIAAPCC